MTVNEELLDRFRTGTLTKEMLQELRAKVSSASEEEMESWLDSPVWDAEEKYEPEQARLDAMERRLMERTGATHTSRKNILSWWRSTGIAAAILIPLVLIGAYFFGRLGGSAPDMTRVVCQAGEERTATLPDGTVVSMRGESELNYPEDFGQGSREVTFTGDGYFEVSRNEKLPFCVSVDGMQVKVLGTVFSLTAPDKSEYTDVFLESGRVEVTSLKTGTTAQLTPGCSAIVDRKNGQLTVESAPEGVAPDWKMDELIFDNVEPDMVIASIEKVYGRKLPAKVTAGVNSNFTGALPRHDYERVMKILGRVYNL